MFEEYASAIQQRYPQLQIRVENFPPKPSHRIAASTLRYAKFAALGVVVFGEQLELFSRVGVSPPDIYTWATNNKVISCMTLFFLGNAVEGGLMQTGAFEIDLDGEEIWSKLKVDRLPQSEELFDTINNKLHQRKFGQPVPPKPPSAETSELPPSSSEVNNDDSFQEFEDDSSSPVPSSSSPMKEDEDDSFKEFDS